MISFCRYTNGKNKYTAYKAHHEKTLARHTVTTNGGALKYLLSDAAGQEAKEFVVAYTILALTHEPMTVEQLRESANKLLKDAGLKEIDFDAGAACLFRSCREAFSCVLFANRTRLCKNTTAAAPCLLLCQR